MDPDLQQGNQGNLVRVSAPRAMHLFGSVNSAGRPKEFWIEDNAKETFKYNAFGQVNWHKDAHGVISEFTYYPDATPFSGGASAGGGGFLAASARDTTANSYRDNYYLRGVPLQPRTTRFRYDAKGHLREWEDPAGNVFRAVTSDLDEVIKITRPSEAAADDERVAARHLQPGQPPESGGPERIERLAVDHHGNVTGGLSTIRQGTFVEERMELNRNGETTAYFPPDAVTGPYPNAGVRMNLDARGLPRDIQEGAQRTGASSLYTHSLNWSHRRTLRDYTPAGSPQPYTLDQDGFGDPRAVIDPMGNVRRVVREPDGTVRGTAYQLGENGPNAANRSAAPSESDAPVISFEERIVDEMGRPTRRHTGRFKPNGQGHQRRFPGRCRLAAGHGPRGRRRAVGSRRRPLHARYPVRRLGHAVTHRGRRPWVHPRPPGCAQPSHGNQPLGAGDR